MSNREIVIDLLSKLPEDASLVEIAREIELLAGVREAEEDDGQAIPPEIEAAHITEVRRRIAQVESGEVTLIPGDEAMAQVRAIIAAARAAS